ncbi:peroxiredoxin [Kistimonas asteriae]|uniref:peroxiredoxin n=1 Tax=Kistimonas asteriae TaxID=517724 RepID=UPI001BAAAEDB|nr:peroxiredoxin [Kistimonas asteriae]
MKASIGKPTPDFTAQATSGNKVDLSALKGQNIVLYFYPKDNTPGCTSEGQSFKTLHPQFQAANTLVFGVSRDSLESHELFKDQYQLPFELIADTEGLLCELFDVLRARRADLDTPMVERSTFLIDREGILQHEWRRVHIKQHVEDVLQAAQALSDLIEPAVRPDTEEE